MPERRVSFRPKRVLLQLRNGSLRLQNMQLRTENGHSVAFFQVGPVEKTVSGMTV
jgi:hypothetical protein